MASGTPTNWSGRLTVLVLLALLAVTLIGQRNQAKRLDNLSQLTYSALLTPDGQPLLDALDGLYVWDSSGTKSAAQLLYDRLDNDQDGLANLVDECDNEAPEPGTDLDFNGCTDVDTDGDGLVDFRDQCDNDAPEEGADLDGNGCTDFDSDGDGLVDHLDMCDDDAPEEGADLDGNGCTDVDTDEDGLVDFIDECPEVAPAEGTDRDNNGCPDLDTDLDGFYDDEDACDDGHHGYDSRAAAEAVYAKAKKAGRRDVRVGCHLLPLPEPNTDEGGRE